MFSLFMNVLVGCSKVDSKLSVVRRGREVLEILAGLNVTTTRLNITRYLRKFIACKEPQRNTKATE
jgi:hypothetical protein